MLVGAAIALGGCPSRREDASSSGTPGTAPSALAAVPAPADLAAELIVPNPEASWSALRAALGEDAVMVPRSVGGLLVGLLGLPLRAAQEFDEKLPIVGALASDGAMALGIHVRSGSTLRLVLASGQDAAFDVDTRDAVALLRPRVAARAALVTGLTLAVVGNYLVLASSDGAALNLGPFLARTLGPRGTLSREPGNAVRADVLLHGDGPNFAAAMDHLVHAAPRGLDPELSAQLAPIVDLDALATSLRDTLATTLTTDVVLTLGGAVPRLDATMRSSGQAGASPRPTIAPAMLGELRGETAAAVVLGEALSARKGSARVRAGALAALVGLRAEGATFDGAKLAAALEAIAEGRGDATTVGVTCSGAGPTGFAMGEVNDRKKLETGVGALLALRKEAAVERLLAEQGLTLSVERGRLERIQDEVTRVRLAPRKDDDATRRTDLRFSLGDERYAIAAGADSTEALQALQRVSAPGTLRETAKLEPALKELGERAYAALYVDPLALKACRTATPSATPTGAVTAALGPIEGGVRLRIDVSSAAFGALGRWLR